MAAARAKTSLLAVMKRVGFSDPVSGKFLDAKSSRFEESLSALVALYHYLGRIRWEQVRLRSLTGEMTNASAGELISGQGILVPEFPLLHSTDTEMNMWGAMRIDLLYFERGAQAAGFIDSKLGSRFHYELRPDTIQPARYLEYLLKVTTIPKRFFVFATSEALLTEAAYLPLLRGAFDHSEERRGFSSRHVVTWEDVVAACATK